MEILNTLNIITDHGNTPRDTLDLNEWSGCVSCSGLDNDDDDDDCDFDDDASKATIYFDSSTSIGTITDIESETESMKTGDGLKLIEVNDDLDDDEKSDTSSVYDADIFDQISNCDIGVINDYDAYDHDSKTGRIPDYIFLLTGEHKQDHEYTIEIEFEEEEIDFQNRTKDGNNDNDKDDNETDACTMATKMLDVSSSTYDDDDEESFPCVDDSQYDNFAFGDDDEEEDISIINDVDDNDDENDEYIIKVQELSSMIESSSSSSSSIDNDNANANGNDNGNGNGNGNGDDDDDDDNDCLSMIDNLMEQFESDILELKSDISIQFYDTDDTTDTEPEAMTALSPTTRNICCDETFITTNTTTRIEDDVDDDVSVVADTLLEQFQVDLLELKKEMARKFGTHNADDFFSSLPPTSTTTTTAASESSRAAPFSIIASALTTASATATTTTTTTICETPNTTIVVLSEEDDEIDDDVDIFMDSSSYDLDKEHHNHHHPSKHASLSIATATATATTCEQTPKTTTPIIKIDNKNDSDNDMDSKLSSSGPNHHDPLQTAMELCQNHRHHHRDRQYSSHPCHRTETIEECEGGAQPPRQSVRRKIQDYESAEIRLKRQRMINNIVNDMKLIHNNHTKMETKQPIQFISQQYIRSRGQ